MIRQVIVPVVLAAILLAGCTVLTEEAQIGSGSPLDVSALMAAESIDVYELNGADDLFYRYRLTIEDPVTVGELATALAATGPPVPQGECPARYRLTFVLENGETVPFGYACLHATPAFLRQDSLFGAGMEVVAPDEFNRIFEEALATGSLQASIKQ